MEPIKLWKDLEQFLKCPVCMGVFEAPVSLKCGHIFCSFCIRRFLKKNSRCPICLESNNSGLIRICPAVQGIVTHLLQTSDGKFRKLIRRKLRESGANLLQDQKTPGYIQRQRSEASQNGSTNYRKAASSTIGVYSKYMAFDCSTKTKPAELRKKIESLGIPWNSALSPEDCVRRHQEFVIRHNAMVDLVQCGGPVQLIKSHKRIVDEILEIECPDNIRDNLLDIKSSHSRISSVAKKGAEKNSYSDSRHNTTSAPPCNTRMPTTTGKAADPLDGLKMEMNLVRSWIPQGASPADQILGLSSSPPVAAPSSSSARASYSADTCPCPPSSAPSQASGISPFQDRRRRRDSCDTRSLDDFEQEKKRKRFSFERQRQNETFPFYGAIDLTAEEDAEKIQQ